MPFRSPLELSTLPRLPRWPLAGNLFEFRRSPVELLRRVADVARAGASDFAVFHLGRRPVVMTTAPEGARAVLLDESDAFEKGPSVRDYAAPLFGEGIVSCLTDNHRQQRQHLAPLFSPRHLDRAQAAIASEVSRARERFAVGSVVDLDLEMRRVTLAIMGRILFSADLLGEASGLSSALAEVNEFVTSRIRNPWSTGINSPLPRAKRARRALARLDQAVGRLIDERRAHPHRHDDLLGHLLRAHTPGARPLSDRQVRDEVVTLLAAGHETTAAALTWTSILLAKHPPVAAALRAEVAASSPQPGQAEAASSPVLDGVLKECLRLYPPVHTIGRESRRAVDLLGHRLPARTIVIVSVFLLHRREEVYRNPESFEPGRFGPENETSIPRFGYLPFGAGPRACMGGSLAMLELRACVAGLLADVELRLLSQHEVSPTMLVTLKAKGPVLAEVMSQRPLQG